jgi:hypothetical protein
MACYATERTTMKSPLKKLEENPNEPIQIADDNECKQLLFELGIAGKFNANLKPTDTKNSVTVQLIVYCDLPSHWILAQFFSGCDNPTDNGYIIGCIPKSQRTYEQFMTGNLLLCKNLGLSTKALAVFDKSSTTN